MSLAGIGHFSRPPCFQDGQAFFILPRLSLRKAVIEPALNQLKLLVRQVFLFRLGIGIYAGRHALDGIGPQVDDTSPDRSVTQEKKHSLVGFEIARRIDIVSIVTAAVGTAFFNNGFYVEFIGSYAGSTSCRFGQFVSPAMLEKQAQAKHPYFEWFPIFERV
jgi:hypothetical protein